ncbi:MAG: PAS/PAC sensor hybrid histidine kinase, partial [uncultured bacterium]
SQCSKCPGLSSMKSVKKCQAEMVFSDQSDSLDTGRTWDVRSTPAHSASGEIIGAIEIAIDISERVKLNNQFLQAQKIESVGRLAGGVAHDFNNMLGVIIGYTEMAMEKMPPSEPLYASLKEIFNAASRSKEITRQLLAFARKQTISPQVLDLNTTVEGMLKMLRRLIGENVELTWKPCNGSCIVNMDPSQIDQILANLCVNSRDAITNVGEIIIETSLANIDQSCCDSNPGFMSGRFIKLSVKDSGCGMDQQTISQLFEPFFTTKEVGKGTGLGLATVFGIVKQNNGFIDVSSEPEKGSTFDIYLPCYSYAAGQNNIESSPEAPKGQGETILIVEDELSLLKISKIMLEKLNYKVLTASSPNAGIRLAKERNGQISLLLTDVIMPEMSGRELARLLLKSFPKLKVMFMSGYTADVIAQQGVLEEGIQFIQKPFLITDLALKIHQTLHNT